MHGSDEVKFKISTSVGDITIKSDPTLGPREFRIEQPAHLSTTKMQEFAARLREEWQDGAPVKWVTIGVDHGIPGADHTIFSTKCVRCSLMFVSKPDGFVDEALENEIAAHQERCFVVGDWVRWEWPHFKRWAEGRFVSLRKLDTWTKLVMSVESASVGNWSAGGDLDIGVEHGFGVDDAITLRRIPRPQQGEAGTPQLLCAGCLAPIVAISAYHHGGLRVCETCYDNVGRGSPPAALRGREPAPVLYDGLTARECWHKWADNAHFVELRGPQALHAMTPAQIAAAKVENVDAMKAWPQRLRAKIAASAEAEQNRVLSPDDETWLANCRDAE